MQITCLVEDSSIDVNFKAEHGLSLHIYSNKNILFDMGATDLFLVNARKLGIDIRDVDIAFISHGHYDHGGGLPYFLKENQKANVYLKKEAVNKYYAKDDGSWREIGLNIEKEKRIKFLSKNKSFGNIHVITEINKKFPQYKEPLYKKSNKNLILDDFSHELFLVIEEKNWISIITGCSHNGILNIVDTAYRHFGNKTIKLLIGGFHMINLSTEK